MIALVLHLLSCSKTPTEAPPTIPSGTPTIPIKSPAQSLPTPTLAVPTKVPVSATAAPATDATIIFQRSGGIAGTSETWTIYTDGRVIGNNGKQGQVASDQVTSLLHQIETTGFFDWHDLPPPRNVCCDRFTYVLTVRTPERENTVTTVDAAPQQPAGLQTILDQVTRLISNITGR
jgi:hypothetical protein